MIWYEGDLWEAACENRADVIVFSANSCITGDGRLVMGAGAALRVRNLFPGIDRLLARQILAAVKRVPHTWYTSEYYLASVPLPIGLVISALQVKRDFRHLSDINLAESSLSVLRAVVAKTPSLIYVMNCPLIGNGGFGAAKDQIFGMLERMFAENDNLIICRI